MHFIGLDDFPGEHLLKIIYSSIKIKNLMKENSSEYEKRYGEILKGRTLLMLFEKPSLRTRVSFEVGMTQFGGHAIYYDIATSPLGKKETIEDFAEVSSRYVDIIMARLFKHTHMRQLASHSSVPVINALTDYSHPCQVLGDFMTLIEKFGKLDGLKLAYLGDSYNNTTHSLLFGCSIMGMDISVACPEGEKYEPLPEVVDWAKKKSRETECSVNITHDANEAVEGANIVYTDSWMSYHIDPSEEEERRKIFMPYQVTSEKMLKADPDAVFMNCLPAMRGYEQTAEVIDGPQSIVFDEAENRLHIQKGIILDLLGLE
ncbi:MAG: ornithine carbamoyltransferase [bacterium]